MKPQSTFDTDESVDFLERMYPNRARHLFAIAPNGRVEARTFEASDLTEMHGWIEARQDEANMFVHVNALKAGVRHKKATKSDIAQALLVHVDVDDPNGLEALKQFEPPPTVIVASGGGYHGYWRMTESTDDLVLVEANDGPAPAGPKGTVAASAKMRPVDLDALPPAVLPFTRLVIEHGDDPERPFNGDAPHFRSRSEAVFRVVCDLARAGCDEDIVAGILLNPTLGISRSILEKRNPELYALRQARAGIAAVSDGWPDNNKDGSPRATMRNTLVALQRLGLRFAHDLFRHRKVVDGNVLDQHQGEISDDACAALRGLIIDAFNFDPRAENVRDAVIQLCLEHSFHPIRQMLDDLTWDGVPRLGGWLANYMGAEDTPLNRAIGKIMLIAAVRRVREPGVKFDTIVIFEGAQGTGKSTALQILAGPDNHADNEILSLSPKEQMEAMEGVWVYELSEMSGLSKSEAEKTKAFASRQFDKARMSYGRFSERRGRQTIFVGTTNETKYLKDRTGNRRFLPVKTSSIDLGALRRDRDQLWAEAAQLEARRQSIVLPPDLWASAAVEQDDRLEDDPWLEPLATLQGLTVGDEARLYTVELLAKVLKIEVDRQNNGHTKRLAGLMKTLGWEAAKFKVGGKTLRGFRRPKRDEHVDDRFLGSRDQSF